MLWPSSSIPIHVRRAAAGTLKRINTTKLSPILFGFITVATAIIFIVDPALEANSQATQTTRTPLHSSTARAEQVKADATDLAALAPQGVVAPTTFDPAPQTARFRAMANRRPFIWDPEMAKSIDLVN